MPSFYTTSQVFFFNLNQVLTFLFHSYLCVLSVHTSSWVGFYSLLFCLPGMAQRLLQMRDVQHDLEHEELQRIRQTALLQCVRLVSKCFMKDFSFLLGYI